MISKEERQKLWELYPEVQELFEQYNGIRLEDDQGWEALVKQCEKIHEKHPTKTMEMLLCDTASQLERLAKKRKYG